jgi:hypothetical protein
LLRPAEWRALGANLDQETRWPGGGEAGHAGAGLGDDLLRGGDADAGDLIELGHLGGERGVGVFDPGGERIDLGGERAGAAGHHARQERVVAGEVPGERLPQDAHLGAHLLAGQVRERVRVALPGDQGGQHVPARCPKDGRGLQRRLIQTQSPHRHGWHSPSS